MTAHRDSEAPLKCGVCLIDLLQDSNDKDDIGSLDNASILYSRKDSHLHVALDSSLN